MALPTDIASRPFRSAARHYLPGRPPYPDRLIRRVAQICRLMSADRVLDLGCGPGMLAAAFAPFAAEIVAMDPEPEMLRVAGEAFGEIGNLRLVRGRSDDLSPDLGAFRLAVMGRSFSWMDRAETLRRLDAILVHGRAVVLFDDSHPDDVPENVWNIRYRALRHRCAESNAANPRRRGSEWMCHEAILLDSRFCLLEATVVFERRVVSAAGLVHRALSMSSTAPDRLGDAAAAKLVSEIEELVREFTPDGMLSEVVETRALIARRQGEGDV